MSSYQKPVAAFVLSLLAGVLITLSSGLWWVWPSSGWGWDWMGGMMQNWNYGNYMHGWTPGGFGDVFGLLGIVFGVIVIFSAIMLYSNPRQHELWGALILAFSVLSVFGFMVFMGVGLLMGIAGGILAILWRPPRETTQPQSS